MAKSQGVHTLHYRCFSVGVELIDCFHYCINTKNVHALKWPYMSCKVYFVGHLNKYSSHSTK